MLNLLFHTEEMKEFFKDDEEILNKIEKGQITAAYLEIGKEKARYFLLEEVPDSKEKIKKNNEAFYIDTDKVDKHLQDSHYR